MGYSSLYLSSFILNHFRRHISLWGALLIVLLIASCSNKKNTAITRRWHSFTAHYNTYFNGYQAYLEGEQAKLKGHRENYTEILPLFLVGNKQSLKTGAANYETAITKCKKAITLHSIKRRPKIDAGKSRSAKTKLYLQRKEFNPFLKNAWLLMGECQFKKGEFLEAAATFSYIMRLYAAEPAVAHEAAQWLARCYTQVDWIYDAEQALSTVPRDSASRKMARMTDVTQANILLHQEKFKEALPYLERVAKHTKGSLHKARINFLLAQIYKENGQPQKAYKALSKCIRQSPPFEMSLNARILQTETLAEDGAKRKKMIKKLRRMARAENNKDYLDQIYFAIGNIHLSDRDTTAAIQAYETGRNKAERSGIEKGILLLRLGSLYWDKRKFKEAQGCYTSALSMIDRTHEDYEMASKRSKVLDKLVPHAQAVQLQDSLQELSQMSDAQRLAAIDALIENYKKQEKEAEKRRKDSLAQLRAQGIDTQFGNNQGFPNMQRPQMNNNQNGEQVWYFYNPMLVIQGKADFEKHWGKRPNEDDWRRRNRAVVHLDTTEEYDYEAEDSIQAVTDSLALIEDSLTAMISPEQQLKDSLENDPHCREYYLKNIPFTPEQLAVSDSIIQEGLYQCGIIEKDDLGDFPLAAETLNRLVSQYPQFSKMQDVYYQLFLLYSRWNKPLDANRIRTLMARDYPDHEKTKLITSPDYEYQARHGVAIEDSLYAATYTAYRNRDTVQVRKNFEVSTDKYPSGLNRPKFILVHALSRLKTADSKTLIKELRDLVNKYPKSDVSQMAGMIVKGLESGRTIGSGTFNLGSLWDRRTATTDANAADSTQQKAFSAERNAPFLFVLAYPTDSVNTNDLLYEMAQFNFTSFVARGFDMSIVHDKGLSEIRIAGFGSYDETYAYASRIMKSPELRTYMEKGRILLISAENLKLVGTVFSLNDYKTFFDENFAPIQLNPNEPIEQILPIEPRYEDEFTPEELEQMNQEGEYDETTDDDGGEWY